MNVSVSFVGASETQLLAPAVLSSVTGILTNFVGDALHVSLPNWSGAAIRSSSSLASGPLYCNVSVRGCDVLHLCTRCSNNFVRVAQVPSEGTWKRLSAVVLLNFVVALDLVGLQASTVPSAVNLNTALVAEAQDVEAEILLALVATVPSVCSVHFEFTVRAVGVPAHPRTHSIDVANVLTGWHARAVRYRLTAVSRWTQHRRWRVLQR